METLCEVFRELGNSLDLEETFATLDRGLRKLVRFNAMSVHLVEAGGFTPGYVAGDGSAMLVSINLPASWAAAPARNLPVEGVGLALAVPLRYGGQAVGVLAIYRRDPYCETDLNALLAIVEKVAAAIHNAQRYHRAEQLAGMDPLTGLLNRRALFRSLDAELARAQREHRNLAVFECALEGVRARGVPCDPDLVGGLLERVARNLRESCREYDTAACSGDHFVLVLAGLGHDDVGEKRKRVEKVVEATGLAAGFPLSVRIGAAFFPEDGSDAEDLLAAAAQRLASETDDARA